MALDDKLADLGVLPKGLTLKEKVYYWTAQVNACMLPFSAIYALTSGNSKAIIFAAANAALAYGTGFALKKSFNSRNGPNAMSIDFRPGISFCRKNIPYLI